ncbi:hypothetical protein [Streptomyces sp. DH12]|uniref:hypothetical protein n=1 Tax=Streptomyces sp. DH12 TaxID=2857010 RepID=UPI001E34B52C|nr:hypothetical protein [Streptomyces sp. DH12]
MSRETDTSSSGPQGRGGAAYPSGTPPYGSPQYQEASGAGAPAQPEEKKTETTLTTRIRINIPGSRPIPPVVVRKPVAAEDQEAPEDESGPQPESPAERTAATPRPEAAEREPSAPQDAPASDWFAPRKPPATGPQTAQAPEAPRPPAAAGPARDGGTGTPAHGTPAFGTPAHGTPTAAAGTPGSGAGANGSGYAATVGAPPRQGGPAPRDPSRNGAPGGAGHSGGPSLPYFSDGPEPPAGPTSGPALGTVEVPPAAGGLAGGFSDDTAILTPQQPHAGPPPAQVSGATLTSGIPVAPQDHGEAPSPFPMSGPARAADAPGGQDAFDAYPPALDEPAPQAPAPTPPPATRAAPAPKKKGRSKLVLLGVAAVTLAGVAYGAGLLLNQADVPKGTTVLGVDIGGSTKEEAVRKLDAVLGERATTPLKLEVGGTDRSLAPDKAGLSLDSQATVRAAAGSDYNPVSVIGSLFGAERVAQPVIPVDEEKLGVALSDLAGGSGSVTEGTVRFEPGKVVPVPGKAGTALDVQRSMLFVKDAYRAQVETGKPNVVELPVATREPTIKQEEIDRAVAEFAEPAMSDLVTIRAGGREIQFGPQRSLPQILSMKPVDGKLVPYYDKEAINRLLDGVFDGVMITKGDGRKHQLSADDVASALQKALMGKDRAERTVTIELDPQG